MNNFVIYTGFFNESSVANNSTSHDSGGLEAKVHAR